MEIETNNDSIHLLAFQTRTRLKESHKGRILAYLGKIYAGVKSNERADQLA